MAQRFSFRRCCAVQDSIAHFAQIHKTCRAENPAGMIALVAGCEQKPPLKDLLSFVKREKQKNE
jgi:hypothetical protein